MAGRTIRIGNRQLPIVWVWVAGVAIFVLVVPMVTFFLREKPWSFGGAPGAVAPKAAPVREAGVTYEVDRLFAMESAGPDSYLPRSTGPDSGDSPYLEVVAPAPDGDVWVVYHPPGSGAVPRARRIARDGTERASFETTFAATLFTPGTEGDLWVDVAAGSGTSERVVHYDRTGKVLETFPLPAGLFARSIQLDPDGGVWALSEEWSVDPETKGVELQAALVPVALGNPLIVPENPQVSVLDGAFFGDDGLLYRLRAKGEVPKGEVAPPYQVSSWTKEGKQIATYSLPAGVRPFAADAEGRLYAERSISERPVAAGLSTLGDPADETTTIWVVERPGRTTKVPVWRPNYFSKWAPSAWPRSDGALIATRETGRKLEVLELAPSDSVETRAGKPFAPDLTIVEPTEPLSGDPYASADAAQRDLWKLVYSGLVSLDASLQPVPDLAERVPTIENGLVSGDGLTIRWEIKAGVRWHDGKPVGPEDVVATWKYLRDRSFLPHGKPFVGFDAIKDVAVDGQSVVVRLKRPIGVAPAAFFPYVLPAHLLPSRMQANPPLFALPVGSGPYCLKRWEDGKGWYLAAHNATPKGTARVASIRVVFGIAEQARAAFDAASGPVVWDWVDEIRSADLHKGGEEVIERPSGRWWGMLFDVSDGPTSDLRVRAALKADYPRATVQSEIYPTSETSVPVDAYPTVSEAHDGARTTTFGDDAKRAAALLTESGWALRADSKLGREVFKRAGEVLRIGGNLTHRQWNDSEVPPDAVDAIQKGWRALGILDSFNFASTRHYEPWWRFGALSFDHFDVASGVFPATIDPGWGGVFDPKDTPSIDNSYGLGVTKTQDTTLASLYREAEGEYDATKRAAIGREITKRAFDELVLSVGERYEMRRCAVRGPVEGFAPAPLPAGAFSDVTSWRVGEP